MTHDDLSRSLGRVEGELSSMKDRLDSAFDRLLTLYTFTDYHVGALALTDQGKTIYGKNTGSQTITIPTNASVAIPISTIIDIENNGTTAITISTTGITLYHAGTANTGNRTLAAKGCASIKKLEADVWRIVGTGLT